MGFEEIRFVEIGPFHGGIAILAVFAPFFGSRCHGVSSADVYNLTLFYATSAYMSINAVAASAPNAAASSRVRSGSAPAQWFFTRVGVLRLLGCGMGARQKNVLQKKLGSGIKNVLFGMGGLRARLTSRRNIQMISGYKA
jgi:hypothetical protein